MDFGNLVILVSEIIFFYLKTCVVKKKNGYICKLKKKTIKRNKYV